MNDSSKEPHEQNKTVQEDLNIMVSLVGFLTVKVHVIHISEFGYIQDGK